MLSLLSWSCLLSACLVGLVLVVSLCRMSGRAEEEEDKEILRWGPGGDFVNVFPARKDPGSGGKHE